MLAPHPRRGSTSSHRSRPSSGAPQSRGPDATAGPDRARREGRGAPRCAGRSRRAVSDARRTRRNRVRMPRCSSHASNGSEHGAGVSPPRADALPEGIARARQHRSGQHVAVAVEVLGRGVDHEVGAELDRSREHRGRHGVVDGHPHAGGMRQLGRWRARSVISHIGLAGVSSHSSRVRPGTDGRLHRGAGRRCRRTRRRAPTSGRTRPAICGRPSRAPARRAT